MVGWKDYYRSIDWSESRLKFGGAEIIIHYHHYVEYGNSLFMSCHSFGISKNNLYTEDLSIAKEKAIDAVRSFLKTHLDNLESAVNYGSA